MEDVDPENLGQHQDDDAGHLPHDEGEGIAARATFSPPIPDKIECCPHAALALAMASTAGATWGSGSHTLPSSGGSTTEPPEEEDQLVDECSSEWSDFGEYTIGPEQIPDPEDEQSAPPAPDEQQSSPDEWGLIEDEDEV